MSLRLALAALTLALVATGCPDREKVTDQIGGAPGRTMERARDAAKRAQDQASEREKQQLDEE